MTAERWRQVKAIFDRAVECDAAARSELLRESCAGDEDLRREVESLLAAEDTPRSVLERPLVSSGVVAAAAPALARDPMIGRTIGNYVIADELARGGMGTVYRARHLTLPRDVVVKCIRTVAYSEDARKDLRARFQREAHIQSQLDHPNIVRVYEFFTGDGEDFLVLEYVAGKSLRTILNELGRLDSDEAISLATQALDGLEYAHQFQGGMIHRDIKPGNLLVDDQGKLKLVDFGIVKAQGETGLTKTGASPGTVNYMSPEQIRNLPVDARSDIYSLGVTLYEMLTGRLPFPSSGSEYDVLKAHMETEPLPVERMNPEVPAALAAVVARALKREPGARWQTAAEFREALIAAKGGAVAGRRVPRRWVLGGVAAALLVAGAFWFGRRATDAFVAPKQQSIAVLPFTDLSPEKNQEYFAEGIAAELLNEFSKSPGLRVVARTSSFGFKAGEEDTREIGRKLNVSTILAGSVRKQGNTVRITTRLVKSADGSQLWSATYERELDNIFAVQEEIAQAVAGAMRVKLLGETRSKATKIPKPEAYRAFLEGRYFLERFNKDDVTNAAGHFERAIQLDPDYALALVGLAEARSNQAMQSQIPPVEGFLKARTAVDRALALDGDLGEAYSALMWIQLFGEWDWKGAAASIGRAIQLDPGNARIIGRAGLMARVMGRYREAEDLYRRAMQVDPLSAGLAHNAGVAFYYGGLYREAAEAFNKALMLSPQRTITHHNLGCVELAEERWREALAEVEKEKNPRLRQIGLSLAYHALQRKAESDRYLAEAESGEDPPLFQLAEVHAYRGEIDKAFETLEKAYAEHMSSMVQLPGDPLLANLKRDPRWTAMLKRLGLPP